MTYGEIYNEYCNLTNNCVQALDYRPCIEMYDVPYVPNAIVIWLTNGARIIYIARDNSE